MKGFTWGESSIRHRTMSSVSKHNETHTRGLNLSMVSLNVLRGESRHRCQHEVFRDRQRRLGSI